MESYLHVTGDDSGVDNSSGQLVGRRAVVGRVVESC